jgi:hypothetical protein
LNSLIRQNLENFGQNIKSARESGCAAGVTVGQHSEDVERVFDVCAADTKTDFYTTKSPFEAKPRNRKEAQASNYWPQYFDAEHEEMVNHQENGTWSLVPRHSVPKGAKILRTKWVYDDKKGQDGKIVRFEAR